MKYMGSKARIVKYILPFLKRELTPDTLFIEPFCGGCNLTDKIDHPHVFANDVSKPLIALFIALQQGWIPPLFTDRETYYDIKNNNWLYADHEIGWACFCCSFSGKPFAGFAGEHTPDTGIKRNYQTENRNHVLKQIQKLMHVTFSCGTYDQILPIAPAVIYCDPPYKGTTGYGIKFDHDKFWQHCRYWVKTGNKVFISEYSAPADFHCVMSQTLKKGISYKRTLQDATEKLFIHESQITDDTL